MSFFSRLGRKGGFTLLEILMALGVLATGVSVMMGGLGNALTMQNRDETQLQAVLLANNKMSEIETEIREDLEKNKFPDDEDDSGNFGGEFDKFDWESSIRKVEIPLAGGMGGGNAIVQTLLKKILKDIGEAVRVVKLKVMWRDDEDDSPREVVITTHVVKMTKSQ